MIGNGVWGRDIGIERERGNGKIAGKIFKIDTGGGLENAGIHGEGGVTERKVEG